LARTKVPATPAVRFLRDQGVDFTVHPYKYEEKGGTEAAARQLDLDHHRVIKTLVMEDDAGAPLIVLMHGDRQVSTKALARAIGARSVDPADPRSVQRHTGYQVGGTSPFGTKKALPVYVEATILRLPTIFINAGKRGLLVEVTPADLTRILQPTSVEVAR
jgi:Cys-tRNA(Pro) deacylase